MNTAAHLLARRIHELDCDNLLINVTSGLVGPQAQLYRLLLHFVNVMSCYTHSLMEDALGTHAWIDPEVADSMAGTCRFLSDITALDPGLTAGPLSINRQVWTQTGRRGAGGDNISNFRFILPVSKIAYGLKPSGMGLYTSTQTPAGHSMWRILIESVGSKSILFPRPWSTWTLEPSSKQRPRIVEIGNAKDWVNFICTYALERNNTIEIDWSRVAKNCDGVHITLPAIVAAQGFRFRTDAGLVRPAFWDVESTFWIKWVFSSPRLVEHISD
jgi:hypothetical protein